MLWLGSVVPPDVWFVRPPFLSLSLSLPTSLGMFVALCKGRMLLFEEDAWFCNLSSIGVIPPTEKALLTDDVRLARYVARVVARVSRSAAATARALRVWHPAVCSGLSGAGGGGGGEICNE